MVLIPKSTYDRWMHSKDGDSLEVSKQQEGPPNMTKEEEEEVPTHKDNSEAKELDERTTLPPADDDESAADDKFVSSAIIDKLPVKHRLYGKRLLSYIRKHGKNVLKWEDDGTLIYEDGVVEGSDITDLIKYLFSNKKKKVKTPVGMQQFRKGMEKIRVPKAFMKPFLLKPPGIPANIKKNWVKY